MRCWQTFTRVLGGLVPLVLSVSPAGCGPGVDLPSSDAGSIFVTPTADAGGAVSTDAGGGDAGEDAGASTSEDGGTIADAGTLPRDAGTAFGDQAEGEPCDDVALCLPGLSCVPEVQDPAFENVCRVDCRAVMDGEVVELPEICPEFTSCQTIIDDTASLQLASACMPIQYARDFLCPALEDPDACALDRMCVATDVSTNADGVVLVDETRCKDVCPLGAPDAEAACVQEDVCLRDPITIAAYDYQLANPFDDASRIACTAALCPTSGSPGCPCDDAEGFVCDAVAGGEWCVHPRGLCGELAPYVSNANLPLGLNDLCNETADHRYCDREPYRDIDNAAIPLCLAVGGAPLEGDGICVAFCSQIAFDYDGDGQTNLTGNEGPFERACSSGEFCDTAFSREIGLFSSGGTEVPCSPDVCPPGVSCGQCGGAQCVTSDVFTSAPSVCAAVFGTCQPEPVVVLDAGPAPDAGEEQDASSVDAAMVDAGDADDAGGDGGYDAGSEP